MIKAVHKFFAILIISIILLSQASFVLAVAGEIDIGGEDVCDYCCNYCELVDGIQLECIGASTPCDVYDPATKKNWGECQKPGEIALCPPITHRTISELIEAIINFVFYVGVIVAPLMILVGAWTFMTAGGSPEKITSGKKIMFWTLVGLAVILFSKGIIAVIKTILGG